MNKRDKIHYKGPQRNVGRPLFMPMYARGSFTEIPFARWHPNFAYIKEHNEILPRYLFVHLFPMFQLYSWLQQVLLSVKFYCADHIMVNYK